MDNKYLLEYLGRLYEDKSSGKISHRTVSTYSVWIVPPPRVESSFRDPLCRPHGKVEELRQEVYI
jgi:hypothetical protein